MIDDVCIDWNIEELEHGAFLEHWIIDRIIAGMIRSIDK